MKRCGDFVAWFHVTGSTSPMRTDEVGRPLLAGFEVLTPAVERLALALDRDADRRPCEVESVPVPVSDDPVLTFRTWETGPLDQAPHPRLEPRLERRGADGPASEERFEPTGTDAPGRPKASSRAASRSGVTSRDRSADSIAARRASSSSRPATSISVRVGVVIGMPLDDRPVGAVEPTAR